jgi:thiol-disulfide isomerase/thioredoxin
MVRSAREQVGGALGAILVLGAALLGCKSSADISADPAASAHAATAVPAGHMLLADAPDAGDVETAVRNALAKAAAGKRKLVVYVGAKWCEPCQRFHRAAEAGELDAAFPDLMVLTFDLDRDNERLASAGYVSKFIPLFALPKADGTASGKQVEGGIKGEGAVAYLTPKLRAMLDE